MTLKELIERAVDIASVAQETGVTKYALEAAAEPLLPIVFSEVSERLAASADRHHLLRRANVVAFVNGVVTVPESVFTTYLSESTLYDTADLTAIYSYVPEWSDFIRYADTRLGTYTVNESSMYVVQPAAFYANGTGLSGNLTLVMPSVVAVPATIGAAVIARDEVVDDLIAGLAAKLGGAVVAHS